jgi:ABC-type glycerol-3-phosphate transport system substrate-binding protein
MKQLSVIGSVLMLVLMPVYLFAGGGNQRQNSGGAAQPSNRTITINTQAGVGSEAAWKAVAEGYKKHHPEVNIVIDLKPNEGYSEWLQTMFATANPAMDIVNINLAWQASAGKSINWLEYVDQKSPYSNGKWRDQFNFQMQNVDLARQVMSAVSLESVQVLWLYNKDIFAKVGVQPPKTWNELVQVCEKLYAAGYQPISIPGDFNSFWAMQMGWLARIYPDQTTRSQVNLVRAQPGDYLYDPDVDGVWKFDPTDPYNDDSWKVNQILR